MVEQGNGGFRSVSQSQSDFYLPGICCECEICSCFSVYALESRPRFISSTWEPGGKNIAVLLEAVREFSKGENGMGPNHSREPLQLFPSHFLYLVSSILHSVQQIFIYETAW